MIRRLLRWRPRRPGAIAQRLEAEGFVRYDRADFAPGTRGARGSCARLVRHHNSAGQQPLRWQVRTAAGALFAYCEPCAWDAMVERRARHLHELREASMDLADTINEAKADRGKAAMGSDS